MKVVVASGKGGTGKTLVATSLALMAAERGRAALLDADVEAPNAALFLRPALDRRAPVELLAPVVDQARCTHCGRCAEVCRYHAIASLPATTLVFEELCHGCGSCSLHCPTGAISESPRSIGEIESGWAGDIAFAQGVLRVGEAMATPVIRALKRYAHDQGWDGDGWLISDAPPGTSCPVIEALRGAGVAVLVTEPTPFGLHDLQLAVEVARDTLRLPVIVVINKAGQDQASDYPMEEYCRAANLPVGLRIPLRREIARVYSTGQPLARALPEYRAGLAALLDHIERLAEGGRA